MSEFSERRSHWNQAVESNSVEIWRDYISGLEGYDLFPFVKDFGHLRELVGGSKELTLSTWLNHMLLLGERKVREHQYNQSLSIRERLPLAAYLNWCSRVRALLREVRYLEMHTGSGAFTYYSDLLQCAILVSFEMVGETVEVRGGLAIPQPHAYLDPVQAIRYAKTRADVDVIKRTLASQQRLVIQRDVVVAVDRDLHRGVFGPTIDTLFVNDWVFVNYLRKEVPWSSIRQERNEARFLEIGTGNGLLSATIARHGPTGAALECVDVDVRAILCTERNVRAQASFRQDRPISADYFVGCFDSNRHPNPFDLVISNPPYIPIPTGMETGSGSRETATLGTSLISTEIESARRILRDDGTFVLVSSKTAEPEIAQASDAAGLRLEACVDRRVPFDIEGLSDEHLRWLVSERGLERDGPSYSHRICIYRIGG